MPFKSFTEARTLPDSRGRRRAGAQSGAGDVEDGIVRSSRGEAEPQRHSGICGVCGRTLLTGETPEIYFEPHGVKPVVVCPVCRAHVRDSGYSKAY